MMNSYNTGNSGTPIGFQIDIGTVGVALTDVHTSPPSGQWQKVVGIKDKYGDVSRFTITKELATNKLYVLIRTFVDFSSIDQSLWGLAKGNVFTSYKVDGGPEGNIDFSHQSDDLATLYDGKNIVIFKIIEML